MATDSRIPIETLPARNRIDRDGGSEIVVIGDILHIEDGLELSGQMLLANKDAIQEADQCSMRGDAVWRRVLNNRLIVLPIVVNGFRDSRAGNGTPKDVRILHA